MDTARPEKWKELPVRIGEEDIVSVYLTEQEALQISEYCEEKFDRKTTDRFASQWVSSKDGKMRAPNVVGIRGEWAGAKYFQPDLTLDEFLSARPWKIADMGDVILSGKRSKIFDYKTRTRTTPIQKLLADDTWNAEIHDKFADRQKYGYLQAFIYCVNDEKNNVVHIVGWMDADEFFERADLILAGQPVPHFWGAYGVNQYLLPYRRLRPIRDLANCICQPISHELTLEMRKDWKADAFDLTKYLPAL